MHFIKMEESRIIKLSVITEDKSIKRYPVIIPNDIFDENTINKFQHITNDINKIANYILSE